jgi:transcriptional/translational regulatory protein YebC/TACO1
LLAISIAAADRAMESRIHCGQVRAVSTAIGALRDTSCGVSQVAICRYHSACLHDDAADVSIESARFEGYGPGGAAVIVDCLIDNPPRVVAELRHVFTKFGGSLGAPGSVAYLFKPVGRMSYPPATDLAGLRRLAFNAGVEDIVVGAGGGIEVLTDPWEFDAVRARLSSAGFVPAHCDVTERASITVPLAGSAAYSMLRLQEALRELEAVQGVYSNAEIPDEVVAQL